MPAWKLVPKLAHLRTCGTVCRIARHRKFQEIEPCARLPRPTRDQGITSPLEREHVKGEDVYCSSSSATIVYLLTVGGNRVKVRSISVDHSTHIVSRVCSC
ncbi:hypothetical protein PENSPDRAFT_508067 [Peniophora sp. CONT]|nr:hypothetical protein PENSPDRAFT_508067 [Peniophora sp. CONT]